MKNIWWRILLLLLLGSFNLSYDVLAQASSACNNKGGDQDGGHGGGGFEGGGGSFGGRGATGSWDIPIIFSSDPNDITGPKGFAEKQWVSINDKLKYTIRFENDPKFATAPAQNVFVNLPVDPRININTLRLSNFGFGHYNFEVPENSSFYSSRLDVRDSLGIYVDITAGIDITKNEVFWIFRSVDPATGTTPTDALKGFLAVNDSTLADSVMGAGDAFVSFLISPKKDVITADTVSGKASIVFDTNDAILTNTWTNTIDAFAPVSKVKSATATQNTITLTWSGQDDAKGAGVNHYALYVSENDSTFLLYNSEIPDTTATYLGTPGNTYKFFTLATDHVGNPEPLKTTGEATIKLALEPEILACEGTGSILWQYWANLPTGSLATVPINTQPTEARQLASFSAPVNIGDNYGARARGYICPPLTGDYVFFITSDDQSELWLSTDENPVNKQKIAFVTGFNLKTDYDKYPNQQSQKIYLKSGQRYYIEAIHRETGGNDHLSVGWKLTDGTFERPIAGSHLVPFVPGIDLVPSVVITSPFNKAEFTTGTGTSIQVNAVDAWAQEIKVEFFAGTTKLGEDEIEPYSLPWENLKAGTYVITAKATNKRGLFTISDKIEIVVKDPVVVSCAGTGGVLWQYWANLPAGNLATIPVNTPPTEARQLTSFDAPVNLANNYGARVSGYICPPMSGDYVFYITSDDQSELWLSTDENPANKQKITSVYSWAPRNQYDKFPVQQSQFIPAQQSQVIYLKAGQRYYIEALHREIAGKDHLSVGWKLPDGTLQRPIAGAHLIPFQAVPNVSAKLASAPESLSGEEDILNVYPNPFSDIITIDLSLKEDNKVVLEIFDTKGRLIKTVYKGKVEGKKVYHYSYNGSKEASGMYICRLSYRKKILSKNIILVK